MTLSDDLSRSTQNRPHLQSPPRSWITMELFIFNELAHGDWVMHNHPSGDPTPSTQDVRMTQDIIAIASPLGISVHDHIVVGRQGHASMKALKLIRDGGRRHLHFSGSRQILRRVYVESRRFALHGDFDHALRIALAQ